jgi:hypothetical protein
VFNGHTTRRSATTTGSLETDDAQISRRGYVTCRSTTTDCRAAEVPRRAVASARRLDLCRRGHLPQGRTPACTPLSVSGGAAASLGRRVGKCRAQLYRLPAVSTRLPNSSLSTDTIALCRR